MYLDWYGANVSDDIDKAIITGLLVTMADCVSYAQQPPSMGGAPVVTGWLSGNIEFERPVVEGDSIVGRWGNINRPDYALLVHQRNPYLQRAADQHYDQLEQNIEDALESERGWFG